MAAYSPPWSDESEIELLRSLMSWLIWSSSLATGSGVAGAVGPDAEAESDALESGEAVSTSPTETPGEAGLKLADGS
jgi:hypothetical protein